MAQANKQNIPGGSVEIVDTPVTATISTPLDISTSTPIDVEVVNNINNITGQYLSLSGAAEALAAAACESAIIQADEDNANPVYVGFDNTVVAGNAIHRLQPGKSISINVDNTNRVWVIGTGAEVVRVLRVNIV